MKKKSTSSGDVSEKSIASGNSFDIPPAEKKAILRKRARQLACPTEKEQPDQEQLDVLEFLLAHETYAVASADVREVYPLTELTPLPCTPAFVRGLINVRGQILTVIDIKKFFDLPERGITNLNTVIIVGKDAQALGILADEIYGIRSVTAADIQPPPSTFTGIRAEYLKGITGGRLIILDLERLLTDERLIVHQDVE